MGMTDPKPTFAHLARELKRLHPKLAYLHAVEPRVSVSARGTEDVTPLEGESNNFLRDIWAPLPFISGGGYTRDSGIKTAEEKGDLIAYGRWYLANVCFKFILP